MTYKELQEQAKGLGLPYAGVSEIDLKKSIEEALGDAKKAPEAPIETPPVAPKSKPTQENKKAGKGKGATKPTNTEPEKKQYDVLIIKKEGREIRKYTLLQHGPEFDTIARTYAEHHGYDIEETTEQAIRKCSECGRPLE